MSKDVKECFVALFLKVLYIGGFCGTFLKSALHRWVLWHFS